MKICTIGGGSGMPVVNQALIRAGFMNISSIVTTFDSGGDTGRMRTDERGRILAYSDYWRSLMSLWKDGEQKEVWQKMLGYRDGRGRNFGNTFFQFMAEREGGLMKVENLFVKLTKAEIIGKVVPVSKKPAEICFRTISGKEYRGEHKLDELRMSADRVEKVWLSEDVEAGKEARLALERAEIIIICPGSMYGSVLINFLPKGIKDSYCRSKARKVLITNIMTVRSENYNFDQDEYLRVFEKYLGRNCLDLAIMPNLKVLNKKELERVKRFYRMERSYPVKIRKDAKIKTIVADIALIEKENFRLRHSEEKLDRLFSEILA
jgi:uncharacterized cofD-like protein